MPIDVNAIPRDDNGAIQGLYRLRHRDETFSDSVAGVMFQNGVTTEPVTGFTLQRLAAAMGPDLDMEPIGTDVAVLPEGETAPLAPQLLPRRIPLQHEPRAREVLAAIDTIDALELREFCEQVGIVIDKRWKQERIARAVLRELTV